MSSWGNPTNPTNPTNKNNDLGKTPPQLPRIQYPPTWQNFPQNSRPQQPQPPSKPSSLNRSTSARPRARRPPTPMPQPHVIRIVNNAYNPTQTITAKSAAGRHFLAAITDRHKSQPQPLLLKNVDLYSSELLSQFIAQATTEISNTYVCTLAKNIQDILNPQDTPAETRPYTLRRAIASHAALPPQQQQQSGANGQRSWQARDTAVTTPTTSKQPPATDTAMDTATDTVMDTALAALLGEIQQLSMPATIYLYWDCQPAALAPATGRLFEALNDGFQQLTQNRIKLIIATPSTGLADEHFLANFEVLDIPKEEWNFHRETFERNVRDLASQYKLQAPNEVAVFEALRAVAPHSLNIVFQGALQHGWRLADPTTPPPPPTLEDLQAAVDIFKSRAAPAQADANTSEDTSLAEQYKLSHAALSNHTLNKVIGEPAGIRAAIDAFLHPEDVTRVLKDPSQIILLEGPPGTGKTTLAMAIAADTRFPLFAPGSSDLINSFIGKSAQNVYNFLQQCKRYSIMHRTPVIIFFDEIDAILGERKRSGSGGDAEYARLVNAMLECMDGVKSKNNDSKVLMIMATNHVQDLDSAVMSRISTKLTMPLPDQEQLQQLFKLHLEGLQIDDKVSSDEFISTIAKQAEGFSGRQVKHVVGQAGQLAYAAYLAYRDQQQGDRKEQIITTQDMQTALQQERDSMGSNDGAPPQWMYM